MKPIYLIGYMGSGKSTLGKELARALHMTFIDLDERIEAMCGCTVSQIFSIHGEAHFRQLEQQALREVSAMTGVVVACGGGTPCQQGNMQLMNDTGITVWLTTSVQRLTARLLLEDEKRKRPRVAALPDDAVLAMVEQELQQRTPHYAMAHLQFDSTDIETAQATTATARRLATVLQGLMND